jgi:DNA invertase Pin-like site-specific DNA recombinase
VRTRTLYRVSTKGQVTKKQNEEEDIPMQRIACQRFAEQNHWRIDRECLEKGVSGYKVSADDRDEIQRLLQAAKNHEFNVLLVYKFDRIGRIEDETPFLVQTFVKLGVEVWSAIEGQRKFDNHVDTLTNFIYYWQAQGESENTSIRIKTRITQLTESGCYTGGTVAYGYDLVHNGRISNKGLPVYDLAVNPVEAEVVRGIFHKTVHDGVGSHRVAASLNERGLRTHSGGEFQSNTINRILKNELYTGFFVTKSARSGHIPELQIVDDEVFARAQKVLKQRTTVNEKKQQITCSTKGQVMLSGLVFCGH